jgi:hypothetical protein
MTIFKRDLTYYTQQDANNQLVDKLFMKLVS